jgi:hypothetical protein
MPEYPNMSSGYTEKLNQNTIYCGLPKNSVSDKCCVGSSEPSGPLTVQVPSMLILSKGCPAPTPAQFALYPKVAPPCSVRTAALGACTVSNSASSPNPVQRFSKYNRYQPPPPCAPLPASARMAGISKPSIRPCNL